MKIIANVEGLDLSTVVDHAYDHDAGGEMPVTLADKVAAGLIRKFVKSDLYRGLKERVLEVRDEEIRTLIIPMITKAVEASFHRTNTWGEKVSETTTMRTVIMDEVKKVLEGLHGNSYGRNETLGRQLIREMVEKELRSQLSAAIKEEREKVIAAVRTQAADLIAEAVTKGIGGR